MILEAKDKLQKNRLSVAQRRAEGQRVGVADPAARRKWLLVNRKMASDNGFFDFLDGFFNIIISIIYRGVGSAALRAQFKLRNGQD